MKGGAFVRPSVRPSASPSIVQYFKGSWVLFWLQNCLLSSVFHSYVLYDGPSGLCQQLLLDFIHVLSAGYWWRGRDDNATGWWFCGWQKWRDSFVIPCKVTTTVMSYGFDAGVRFYSSLSNLNGWLFHDGWHLCNRLVIIWFLTTLQCVGGSALSDNMMMSLVNKWVVVE